MPILVEEYITIFLEKRDKCWNSSKLFSPYLVCHKFVLRSVKRMNRIFWAKEFRFKASKCQIWLGIKKPFFWESDRNFDSFQKLFPNIWASYKFVLRSVNSLNRIFWGTEYWFNALKCQIWLTNQKHFSRKARQTLKLPKNVLPLFEFFTKLFWSLLKA